MADTSSYPYDAVVSIFDVIGGQWWQGSGVLISPDEVLTASHVVYHAGVGTASKIQVFPGTGVSLYGTGDGAQFHYEPIDDSNGGITNQQSQYDYAVIHLTMPFVTTGYMGLTANFAGGPANVTGYPASPNVDQVTSSQIMTLDPNYTILDGTSLGEGSSGGPVWINSPSGPLVVGLVSTGSGTTGYDTLITPSALNQIETWVAQDDGTGATVFPSTVAGEPSHTAGIFEGPRTDYTIAYNGNGSTTVTDSVPGRDGTMASLNSEVLLFADQPYFIENGDGANIARLYSAGLGRIPDTTGQFGWEDLYRQHVGAELKAQGIYVPLAETPAGFNGSLSIADGIIDSPEFVSKYGALSNAGFVTQLYSNVLGRGPEAGALDGWLNYMTPANPADQAFTRGMVLVGFAESAENIARSASWLVDTSRSG